MNPYQEDEYYEDECDGCGSHFDVDGWCPSCDYYHYDVLDSWDEEGEDHAQPEQWNAQRAHDMFGPDGEDEDGTPYVELM